MKYYNLTFKDIKSIDNIARFNNFLIDSEITIVKENDSVRGILTVGSNNTLVFGKSYDEGMILYFGYEDNMYAITILEKQREYNTLISSATMNNISPIDSQISAKNFANIEVYPVELTRFYKIKLNAAINNCASKITKNSKDPYLNMLQLNSLVRANNYQFTSQMFFNNEAFLKMTIPEKVSVNKKLKIVDIIKNCYLQINKQKKDVDYISDLAFNEENIIYNCTQDVLNNLGIVTSKGVNNQIVKFVEEVIVMHKMLGMTLETATIMHLLHKPQMNYLSEGVENYFGKYVLSLCNKNISAYEKVMEVFDYSCEFRLSGKSLVERLNYIKEVNFKNEVNCKTLFKIYNVLYEKHKEDNRNHKLLLNYECALPRGLGMCAEEEFVN